MCDIDKKTRKENYKKLRDAGLSYSFSKRARDFNPTRIKYWITEGHKHV